VERKKYMGVCRWWSVMMDKMVSKFPSTVIRYIERKIPNMRIPSSGSFENLKGRNSEISVTIPGSICYS
jgi:hypothetical protein